MDGSAEEHVMFSFGPRLITTAPIAIETPMVISPYSMALAPESSLRNRQKSLTIGYASPVTCEGRLINPSGDDKAQDSLAPDDGLNRSDVRHNHAEAGKQTKNCGPNEPFQHWLVSQERYQGGGQEIDHPDRNLNPMDRGQPYFFGIHVVASEKALTDIGSVQSRNILSGRAPRITSDAFGPCARSIKNYIILAYV